MIGTRRALLYKPPSSGNWWEVAGKTCVAAYQPKGAASYAASKVNLANPGTFDAVEGVAPTWAAETGWTFDGSTTYLDTGIVAGNHWSVFCRYAGASLLGRVVLGSRVATNEGLHLIPKDALGTIQIRYKGAFTSYDVNLDESGVLGTSDILPYYNGASIPGINTMTGVVTDTNTQLIGCLNNNGVPAAFYDGTVIAVVYYQEALTPAEVATLSAAMAAL